MSQDQDQKSEDTRQRSLDLAQSQLEAIHELRDLMMSIASDIRDMNQQLRAMQSSGGGGIA